MIMQLSNKQYSGKIMLFGEYSVIIGSSAYLIPYRKVHARLDFQDRGMNHEFIVNSNLTLKKFAGYLLRVANDPGVDIHIDMDRFNSDLDDGLYLYSTIPATHGLGSSGAVCAAVYGEYGTGPDAQDQSDHSGELTTLKEIFSNMESFFHGFSSGVDPLCIYSNSPIVIDDKGIPAVIETQADNYGGLHPFLIVSQDRSHTGPLVEAFRDQMKRPEIRNDFVLHYVPYVNKAVKQLTAGKLELETIMNISERQMVFLAQMIPEQMLKVWSKGIKTGLYACKLCGSGGGGMTLGFAKDLPGTKEYLQKTFKLSVESIQDV